MVPQRRLPIELIDVRGLKGKGLGSVLSGLLPPAPRVHPVLARAAQVAPGRGGGRGRLRLGAGGAGRPAHGHPHRGPGAERGGRAHQPAARHAACRWSSPPSARPERQFPARKVQHARQPHPPAAARELHAPGHQVRREFRGCSSSAAPRARTASTCGSSRRCPPRRPARPGDASSTRPGPATASRCEKGYAGVGFTPDVREFIEDMSAAYAQCDLVVCRAGATTLAELTVGKKPSILVPFPAAADNHQEVNAQSLVDAGAAVMIEERDLTGELLAAEMRRVLLDPGARERMARAAGLRGAPRRPSEIADVLTQLTVRRWGTPKGRDRGQGFRPVRPAPPPHPARPAPHDPLPLAQPAHPLRRHRRHRHERHRRGAAQPRLHGLRLGPEGVRDHPAPRRAGRPHRRGATPPRTWATPTWWSSPRR